MNNAGKMIVALMASSLLAGCQSFPLSKLGFGKPKPSASMPAILDEPGSVVLAEGQEQLRQGNISAAVASFRIAALDADTQADASNGLGIAYAKLGRADLADRYFRSAALLDPANTKYAANLARLHQAEYFAMRSREDAAIAQAAASAVQDKPVSDSFAAAFETPVTNHVTVTGRHAAQLTRVSRGEIRITGASAAHNAPSMKVEYRPVRSAASAGAKDDAASSQATKQAAADQGLEYPVRVALAPKSKTIRPAYPVRIELNK